ncbi:MAG: septum formation initiator family protein [Candidatus Saccharimonadales bacterium]
MLTKIKKTAKDPRVQQFKDVRVVSLMVFGVILLMVAWSSVKVIQTNYDLQKQIAKFKQQNEVQKLKNENEKLRNQYYKTDQFLELQARRNFGKAAPGETLVLVPKDVALSKTKEMPEQAKPSATQVPNKPTYQKNLESWMDYFLHRT